MRLSPDEIIFWQLGFFKLNATIAYTWALMLVLAVGSKLITRHLSTDLTRSRWQNLLEIVVTGIEKQIAEVGLRHPRKYIGFLGTLFLFLGCTGKSAQIVISEISRTLALAVRLFGNMMSGAMIIGILLSITPFIFPIVMTVLGLLTGMVQSYIFSILAAVYIAAATHVRKPKPEPAPKI